MVKDTGTSQNDGLNPSALREIKTWSYAFISGLVIGIILMMLDIRYISGFFLILTAIAGILLFKKILSYFNSLEKAVKDISESDEKKNKVICIIIASIKASKGERYKYPLSIPFIQ